MREKKGRRRTLEGLVKQWPKGKKDFSRSLRHKCKITLEKSSGYNIMGGRIL